MTQGEEKETYSLPVQGWEVVQGRGRAERKRMVVEMMMMMMEVVLMTMVMMMMYFLG